MSSTTLDPARFRRRSLLRLIRFIRSLPGCERAQIQRMMQETALRETYRIVGQTTIAGYVARQSIEHTLFEMIAWFDQHVKQALPAPEDPTPDP